MIVSLQEKPKQEVENNMQEAMKFHLEGMLMEKQAIPYSHTYSNYLEVEATAQQIILADR